MSKKTLIATIVIVFVFAVSVIVGFYFANQSPKPIQSLSNFYLGDSRIFVVSANATYGSYPFPTVTTPPFASPSESIIAEKGEPCVIINVTLRNDYSTQNPFPKQVPYNATYVYVALAAQIFDGDNQINARDITNAVPVFSASANRAFTSLDYGESKTVSIYLATKNKDITRFQITPDYIGQVFLP